MNTLFKISSCAVLVFGASLTAQAASTGTITFDGELTDSTCEVSVNGQGADATVTLPTVSINELTSPGQTSGRTNFNLQLSDCVPGTTGGQSKVSAFFQAGSTVDPSTGRLTNTRSIAGATLVDLQLRDSSNSEQVINVGSSDQVSDMTYVDINEDGTATLPYSVEYYANGQTTPGKVASSVVYNLQYK